MAPTVSRRCAAAASGYASSSSSSEESRQMDDGCAEARSSDELFALAGVACTAACGAVDAASSGWMPRPTAAAAARARSGCGMTIVPARGPLALALAAAPFVACMATSDDNAEGAGKSTGEALGEGLAVLSLPLPPPAGVVRWRRAASFARRAIGRSSLATACAVLAVDSHSLPLAVLGCVCIGFSAGALLAYHAVGISHFILTGFEPLEDTAAIGRELIPRLRAAASAASQPACPAPTTITSYVLNIYLISFLVKDSGSEN